MTADCRGSPFKLVSGKERITHRTTGYQIDSAPNVCAQFICCPTVRSEGVTFKLAGAFYPCESTVLSVRCCVAIRVRFPRIASTDIRIGKIRKRERVRGGEGNATPFRKYAGF